MTMVLQNAVELAIYVSKYVIFLFWYSYNTHCQLNHVNSELNSEQFSCASKTKNEINAFKLYCKMIYEV